MKKTFTMRHFSLLSLVFAIFMASCSNEDEPNYMPTDVNPIICICKTNGDYWNNVPVMVDASRTMVTFIPGTDIEPPTRLHDDFQVGGSKGGLDAWTKWTYDEWNSYDEPPHCFDMINYVIPEARVAVIYETPYRLFNCPENLEEALNKLIDDGLKDCKLVYKLEE
ncbi:MAG: hypothetical protein NC212_03550 [Staphylococcus sp.]|nr:hypothetical protein [Staphylococcus sp.]